MALDIAQLSGELAVRRLGAEDVPQILTLCSGNPQFYRYHPPMASEDGIRADMQALPPEKTAADKYYVGYFDSGGLAAVLDLILGYPQEGTALIGFFMVDAARQGSRLVSEAAACLRAAGLSRLRLGVDRGNPQSFAFWTKNGFEQVDEGHQINVLLVIADNDSVVRISRNPDENDDRISLRQPLFQRVNAPVTSLCLIPMPLKNIHDAVCGNEAKRSF